MNREDLEALREGWHFEAKLALGRDGRGALNTLENLQKVSVNLLRKKDVEHVEVEGIGLLVIRSSRAVDALRRGRPRFVASRSRRVA